MCSVPRIQCKYRQSDHVNCVEKCNDGIILLTGMRDGLQDARSLVRRPVVLQKVSASDEAKQARGGWMFDPEIDESSGECVADDLDDTFFDVCYENNLESKDAWL